MSDEITKLNEEERDQVRPVLSRAARARAIIEDQMVVDALNAIEQASLDVFKASPLEDSAERERAKLMYMVSQNFRRFFERHLEDGQIAEKNLLDIQTRRSFLQRMRA